MHTTTRAKKTIVKQKIVKENKKKNKGLLFLLEKMIHHLHHRRVLECADILHSIHRLLLDYQVDMCTVYRKKKKTKKTTSIRQVFFFFFLKQKFIEREQNNQTAIDWHIWHVANKKKNKKR